MAATLRSSLALAALLSLARAGSSPSDPNLAKQPNMDVHMGYGGNLTEGALANQGGWEKTKQCVDEYCVYANKRVAGGRGIALVTTAEDMENIRPVLDKLAAPGDAPPYDGLELQKVEGKGEVFVATQDLKRARQLLRLTPVLMVQQTLFNETEPDEWASLLEGAVALLPEATRALFDAQRTDRATGEKKNLRQVMMHNPFQVKPDTGPNSVESEWHYLNYPELAHLQHDCRPSASWHHGRDFSVKVVAARKMAPGDVVTMSHIDHTMSRSERAESSRLMMGRSCTCDSCTGGGQGGDLMRLVRSDARVDEIQGMTRELEDIDSRFVDRHYVNKYLRLVAQEQLQAYLYEYYWRAAINYNYLGYDEQAVKYANKAVQAAILQWGKDAEPVIEVRIFLSDPLGHYSWRRRITLREGKSEGKS